MSEPRILLYDLENAPALGYFWPPMYDTNIITVKEEPYILSFAYTWFNPDGLDPDDIKFERKVARRGDDRSLMKRLWKLMDEADAVMAHNGDRFDQKKALARMVYHELPPPSPYIEIDTLKLAKQKFAFTSNKLDNLARHFGIGEKKPHQGMHTWYGCMDNDPDAWDNMEEYNKHDIVLMDGVYRRLMPYVRTRLNQQSFEGYGVCPKCGEDAMIRRGTYPTTAGVNQRYSCQECGSWAKALIRDDGKLRQI